MVVGDTYDIWLETMCCDILRPTSTGTMMLILPLDLPCISFHFSIVLKQAASSTSLTVAPSTLDLASISVSSMESIQVRMNDTSPDLPDLSWKILEGGVNGEMTSR